MDEEMIKHKFAGFCMNLGKWMFSTCFFVQTTGLSRDGL